MCRRCPFRRALLYPALTPRAACGDRVLLNTTAQDLGLGTGGYDFVVAVESAAIADQNLPGHIMKLRYTPLQHQVLSVEEPSSSHAAIFQDNRHLFLNDMLVICAALHSQVAPALAAIKACNPELRVVYIMTDEAALPLALSRTVALLKDAHLLDATITCGQAYGGDFEAITLHSALVAAKYVCSADIAIVAIGPGTVGTSTVWGTTGIAQGEAVNAVGALHGRPVVALRMSEADRRARHFGISAHSITSLALVANRYSAVVPVPSWRDRSPDVVEAISTILGAHDYFEPHILAEAPLPHQTYEAAHQLLCDAGIALSSMGRSYEDDPLFFDAAYSAGYYAGVLGSKG